MRSIRYKIAKKTRLLLEEAAQNFSYEKSFVIDLYSLLRLKGNGIPSEDRIKKMVRYLAKKTGTSELTVGMIFRKRAQQLKVISATAIFKGLSMQRNSIEAVRTLITDLQTFGKKARQAQCVTCKYLNECEFGKQYSRAVKDITKVIDPDYSKKAHPDCPVLPEIDKANQLAASAVFFSKMFSAINKAATQAMATQGNGDPFVGQVLKADPSDLAQTVRAQTEADEEPPTDMDVDGAAETLDPDETDTPIPAECYQAWEAHTPGPQNGQFTGSNIVPMQDLINKISASNIALFEIGRKFSLALSAQKRGKFAPVKHVADAQQSKKMENLSDITRLQSSQYGLPKEVFDHRLEQKKLIKREDVKHHDKQQLLYLLIDVSQSMSGWFTNRSVSSIQNQLFTRSGLAMTLSIAITKRVEEDKGIIFVRFFDVGTSRLMSAQTHKEYESVRWMIANARFNGSGTSIVPALSVVRGDIVTAAKETELSKAELILISDIEDRFSEDEAKNAIDGIEFNVLDVSGSAFSDQGSSGKLKKIANQYYKANEGTLDVNELVKLV